MFQPYWIQYMKLVSEIGRESFGGICEEICYSDLTGGFRHIGRSVQND